LEWSITSKFSSLIAKKIKNCKNWTTINIKKLGLSWGGAIFGEKSFKFQRKYFIHSAGQSLNINSKVNTAAAAAVSDP
jgi:hypothetical protein